MIGRLDSYLTSKPGRSARFVLALAVALTLTLAGLVVKLSDFGKAPYPSQKVGFSLTKDGVMYTSPGFGEWYNSSSEHVPMAPYKEAWFAFGGPGGYGSGPLLTDPGLSSGSGTPSTMEWDVWNRPNITAVLTDQTSNGVFDRNDTILFRGSMPEDTTFFMALAFFPWGNTSGPWSGVEISFAIHDGKLYSWYSSNLPTLEPWFEPYRG